MKYKTIITITDMELECTFCSEFKLTKKQKERYINNAKEEIKLKSNNKLYYIDWVNYSFGLLKNIKL